MYIILPDIFASEHFKTYLEYLATIKHIILFIVILNVLYIYIFYSCQPYESLLYTCLYILFV